MAKANGLSVWVHHRVADPRRELDHPRRRRQRPAALPVAARRQDLEGQEHRHLHQPGLPGARLPVRDPLALRHRAPEFLQIPSHHDRRTDQDHHGQLPRDGRGRQRRHRGGTRHRRRHGHLPGRLQPVCRHRVPRLAAAHGHVRRFHRHVRGSGARRRPSSARSSPIPTACPAARFTATPTPTRSRPAAPARPSTPPSARASRPGRCAYWDLTAYPNAITDQNFTPAPAAGATGNTAGGFDAPRVRNTSNAFWNAWSYDILDHNSVYPTGNP